MLNIDKINAEFDWNVLFYTSKNLESIQCTQISESTHSSWLDKLNKYCISHFIYQNENIFLLFIANGEELYDEFCLMCNQKLMFNDYTINVKCSFNQKWNETPYRHIDENELKGKQMKLTTTAVNWM